MLCVSSHTFWHQTVSCIFCVEIQRTDELIHMPYTQWQSFSVLLCLLQAFEIQKTLGNQHRMSQFQDFRGLG